MNFARALLLLLLVSGWTAAAPPDHPHVPDGAQASSHFDVETATNAWLHSVPEAARARSDAYFEGGYWLILWDFLYGSVVLIVLLETRFAVWLRDRVRRAFLYGVCLICVIALLSAPLTIYEGYLREHQYHLSNLAFGGWLKEQAIGLALAALFGGLVFWAISALVRRRPATWHVWGAAVTIVFACLAIAIGPVWIAPLFNRYEPLQDQALKTRILSLARASGIPVHDVYENDASKQSKRVSANVSGFLGSERITLNDNLLARCSPEAVLSTMGHEMGHYVLHHILNSLLFLSVLIALTFWLLRHLLGAALNRWGERWRIHGAADLAALPVALLILNLLGLLATPLTNSFTRMQEYEADLYGLQAARQPDGEAEVDLLLGEYRKLDPSALEEMLFFDHPSGRTRIRAAMRWKAENLSPVPSAR